MGDLGETLPNLGDADSAPTRDLDPGAAEASLGGQAVAPIVSNEVASEVSNESPEAGLTDPDITVVHGDAIGDLITTLVDQITEQNPGVEATIAVGDAGSMQVAGIAAPVHSASAVKPLWVVAAAMVTGPESVEEYVDAAITYSDNDASAEVISLVGIDAVNGFSAALGMTDTHLAQWSFGRTQTATGYGPGSSANVTSAVDLVTFYDQLLHGPQFDEQRGTILDWLRRAPDDREGVGVWGGVLTDRLPPQVAAMTAHKAGWLPPDCCQTDQSVILAAGSIPLLTEQSGPAEPDGGFAIAISLVGGESYADNAAFIGSAACEIYAFVQGTTLNCTGDGPIEPRVATPEAGELP